MCSVSPRKRSLEIEESKYTKREPLELALTNSRAGYPLQHARDTDSSTTLDERKQSLIDYEVLGRNCDLVLGGNTSYDMTEEFKSLHFMSEDTCEYGTEKDRSLFDLYERAHRDITGQRVRNRLFWAEHSMREELNNESAFALEDVDRIELQDESFCLFDFSIQYGDALDGLDALEIEGDESFHSRSVSTSHYMELEEAAVLEAEEISRSMAKQLEAWSLHTDA